jgi:hypothetical protein
VQPAESALTFGIAATDTASTEAIPTDATNACVENFRAMIIPQEIDALLQRVTTQKKSYRKSYKVQYLL